MNSFEYIAWRDGLRAVISQHDVRRLQEAGCKCPVVLVDFKDGVRQCGYCDVKAPYPRAQYANTR